MVAKEKAKVVDPEEDESLEDPKEEATETPAQEDAEEATEEPANKETLAGDSTSGNEDEDEVVPQEIETALRTIYDLCEREDETLRLKYLSRWRQLQLYARGIFDLFWDDTARDWRSFSDENDEDDSNQYDRNVNIFRGHMESVIAALSVKIPGTEFYPDDADDPQDIATAQAFGDIVKLVQKHNKSPLLLVKALYILWTQGTACSYNYYRTDPKYGTIQLPNKIEVEQMTYKVYCANCGYLIGQVKETKPTQPLHCNYCGVTDVPENVEYPETITKLVGYTNEPKGREAFDFYGPINVKIPFYAKKQDDCGYLIFKNETHYAMLKNTFPEQADDIRTGNPSMDAYERYMRLLPEYYGQIPNHLDTIVSAWFRPWMYWIIDDEDTRNQLFQLFPNGVQVTYVDETLVGAEDACMDENWTISVDPLSDFIHGEPLGKPLVPVQDMRNDIISLSFQSIEYSIPENFVDPTVLDFSKYKDQRSLPGMFTQAKPKAGQSLGDSFFQTTPSRLTEEVQVFSENLDKDGQFVTHDFPSVYGGPSEGSKTAFEYGKSQNSALQALGLVWKRVVDLWTTTQAKCAVEFASNMKADEKSVKKENGKFLNTWIKLENITGKVGNVEPETSETLPQTWEQKWQLIVEMLQMKDPQINQVLLAPENAELMKQAIGLPEFFVPNEGDRNKQYGEIYDIISEDGNVQVDANVDNHGVHMEVIKNYMTSSTGVALYKTNPTAYQNVINHFLQHQQAMQPPPGAQPGANGAPPQGNVAPPQQGNAPSQGNAPKPPGVKPGGPSSKPPQLAGVR